MFPSHIPAFRLIGANDAAAADDDDDDDDAEIDSLLDSTASALDTRGGLTGLTIARAR